MCNKQDTCYNLDCVLQMMYLTNYFCFVCSLCNWSSNSSTPSLLVISWDLYPDALLGMVSVPSGEQGPVKYFLAGCLPKICSSPGIMWFWLVLSKDVIWFFWWFLTLLIVVYESLPNLLFANLEMFEHYQLVCIFEFVVVTILLTLQSFWQILSAFSWFPWILLEAPYLRVCSLDILPILLGLVPFLCTSFHMERILYILRQNDSLHMCMGLCKVAILILLGLNINRFSCSMSEYISQFYLTHDYLEWHTVVSFAAFCTVESSYLMWMMIVCLKLLLMVIPNGKLLLNIVHQRWSSWSYL